MGTQETTHENEAEKLPESVDRTVIRRLLRLTRAERFRLAVEEARNLARFEERTRK